MERNESYKDLDECCDHPLHDVSGDVIIRDRLTVCGNLRAHKVDPAERGLFLTVESLKESCTVCRKGDWALVGEQSPFKVYRWDNGWYDTETTHEVNIPLNEYLTKEEALQTYVSDAELQEEKTAREQADDSLAQDIADLNNNDVLIAKDIATLKERNNAEIPAYTGIVESATIEDKESVIQYSGVYFIKSEGRFAAKQGSEYFNNWLAYGGYQAQQVYHQDNKAVPNRLYNLIALSGGGLHYFDGTTFKMVNDNAELEETVNTHEGSINNLNNKTSELQTEVDEQTAQIKELKERNKAEIPAYSGVVESATIQPGSATQYSGVYFIKSAGVFAAKVGDKYFGGWKPYDGYQERAAYIQDEKAVPNRLYNLIASSGGGLHYFDGASFKVVNDNADVEEAITALQGRAVTHDDTLTTHGKQITTLQTKVQEVINVNNEQHTTITSQGNRITETEHHIDENTTQLNLLNLELAFLRDTSFVLMQQTIEDLTARIEALEKGGGSSSADVENGTLSANASVVDGVMSVQGSVEDGILKL